MARCIAKAIDMDMTSIEVANIDEASKNGSLIDTLYRSINTHRNSVVYEQTLKPKLDSSFKFQNQVEI